MSATRPVFLVLDDEDNEVVLPSKCEVCPRCRGTGVHDHPAFENGRITQEQFEEDPDFKADYLKGRYDVPCSECKGLRVVAVPDIAQLSDDQKRWLQNKYDADAEARAERRMRDRGIEF